jgi:hypothetical protein
LGVKLWEGAARQKAELELLDVVFPVAPLALTALRNAVEDVVVDRSSKLVGANSERSRHKCESALVPSDVVLFVASQTAGQAEAEPLVNADAEDLCVVASCGAVVFDAVGIDGVEFLSEQITESMGSSCIFL